MMPFKTTRFAILFTIISLGCSAPKNAVQTPGTLTPGDLKPIGRYIIENNQNLELISSAVHFGFSFEGKQCVIFLSAQSGNSHNYFQYELDGVYVKQRIKVEGNASQPVTIGTINEGVHTLWIYKTTEAQTGPLYVQKITGNNIKALKIPDAPVIEFIGNSITCGAAADPSDTPCGTGAYHDQHNAYMAYGPRVARALHTNFTMSSVSGIGIYRNWNSDGPTMPQVYENSRMIPDGPKWDFSRFTPKVVSIALGTNDFSGGDGKKQRLPFDSSAFVTKYISFVQLVQAKYPQAQIALLSSPMVNGANRTLLQNCLTAVKQRVDFLPVTNKKIALFFFQPMQAHGCGGHPNVEDHAILANELIPFFKKYL